MKARGSRRGRAFERCHRVVSARSRTRRGVLHGPPSPGAPDDAGPRLNVVAVAILIGSLAIGLAAASATVILFRWSSWPSWVSC